VDFADEVVRTAWDRQGGRCAKCGRWLIWTYRARNGGTGAWQPHHMTSSDQGGSSALPNCVIFCSGIANCHFNVGHGGVRWSHYAPLDDSVLLFFYTGEQAAKMIPEPTKRSLIQEVFGVRQSTKAKGRPIQKRKPQTGTQAGAKVTRKKNNETGLGIATRPCDLS
jgi:hypothetical protein